jgi:kinetochore-associated protein 1
MTPDKWNLKPVNNAFLQSVLRLMIFCKDKSRAIFILYFVTNHAPEGMDQVQAAYECYKYGMEHEKELAVNPKSSEVLMKIKRKYPIIKAMHLLHLYGFSEDDKLFQLVENAMDLIITLYHHKSILQPQKKNINKLAKDLADLNRLNLIGIQQKLLRKWLAFSHNTSDSDVDVNETIYDDYITTNHNSDDDQQSVNDEFVTRAYYILGSWEKSVAISYLASELQSSTANTENQLQLYECFAKLVDDSTSYANIINPDDYLLLRCCYFLKQLGMSYTVDKFKTVDKVSLLKKIWTSFYNNAKGLELMSLICLGYDINLPQVWNGVLKQMVSLNMTTNLSILVDILSTKSQLHHLSYLKSAWECVIREPFITATKAQSFEQETKLAKSLILLQKCPISTYLNLTEFAEHCLRLDRPHMAAFFVAFCKDEQREKILNVSFLLQIVLYIQI